LRRRSSVMITSNVKSAGFRLLKVAKVSDENSGGGEYSYRYVRPQRVGVFSRFGHK